MYEKLTKNALKCMYIATVLAMLCLSAVFLAAGVFGSTVLAWSWTMPVAIAVVILAILNAIFSPILRYHRYRYRIDEESIDVIEGYLFVERNMVPIERLHKLSVERGPIDRMCKVAKVVVTTAGGDVTIRFLDEEKADLITEGLKKRINDIAVKEKEESNV